MLTLLGRGPICTPCPCQVRGQTAPGSDPGFWAEVFPAALAPALLGCSHQGHTFQPRVQGRGRLACVSPPGPTHVPMPAYAPASHGLYSHLCPPIPVHVAWS